MNAVEKGGIAAAVLLGIFATFLVLTKISSDPSVGGRKTSAHRQETRLATVPLLTKRPSHSNSNERKR